MRSADGCFCANIYPEIELLSLGRCEDHRLGGIRRNHDKLPTRFQNDALIFISPAASFDPSIKHREILVFKFVCKRLSRIGHC